MNAEAIREYAHLMRELDLTGLEVNENGATIRLERGKAEEDVSKPQEAAVDMKEEKGSLITSPMVGVFYTSPEENAEPYVKKGDKVRKGDTLCLIESMKLLNEITADRDGIILEVLGKNATVVGFGTPLFRISEGL
ncbi:MAG: acetyl-CoA carboxylase, biotin carboxyl carrier protein [Spirochaetes bacterium]|uniref:Biotin carboxyl carrier protein of acetyl-CoA carboxylase n=1 Tax=Candidatus Ornithospirochaeta stercoravium TaxID=2840897 RepID=A0A9D9NDG8_9SPIO|nr:acetyl-CoA carboxylase, biotin carboxyl carrier protein [Candidatus Ornithospirochaeta stercoravium]